MEAMMPLPKQWSQMSVDEKLESLWREIESQRRESACVPKALDDLRHRLDAIERRVEELPLS
jgi:hypothetical protein